MKLLFCEKCWDIFKLSAEPRQCKCGLVTGQYINNVEAITNGQGVSLAIGNGALIHAIGDMRRHQNDSGNQAGRGDYYIEGQGAIEYAWVRPNEGSGNPHMKVRHLDVSCNYCKQIGHDEAHCPVSEVGRDQ